MHKEIFMVARKDGTGYRKVSRAVRNTMRNAGTIRLEGVDAGIGPICGGRVGL